MAITLDGSDNKIAIGANATGSSYLRLYEDTDNGTNYVDIIAPASITSNRTLTLPDNTGTILTSGGTISTSQLPAGSVLQVVSATYSTETTVSSTSYADSGLSASITPTSASSKILVISSISADYIRASNVLVFVFSRLVRGATQIMEQGGYFGAATSSTGSVYFGHCHSIIYLDSPATTSSTTYKVQGKVSATANNATLRFQIDNTTSTLTLMEIAA